MGGGRGDLQRCFCKLLIPPPLNAPSDQHRATHIEVSIVCTEVGFHLIYCQKEDPSSKLVGVRFFLVLFKLRVDGMILLELL
jgi:hypothetical protein